VKITTLILALPAPAKATGTAMVVCPQGAGFAGLWGPELLTSTTSFSALRECCRRSIGITVRNQSQPPSAIAGIRNETKAGARETFSHWSRRKFERYWRARKAFEASDDPKK
jgi:hypothetical protein